MAEKPSPSDAWAALLAAERHLQAILPGAVLVGGTAAALHAHHRQSVDGDHVLSDLRERYEKVLADLEATPGWHTTRLQRPVLILGELDGCMTGVRQLRRIRPIATEVIEGLVVPTRAEMARIKAWLLLERRTVRDYLDTVALIETLGEQELSGAFGTFDVLYPRGPGGGSSLVELVECLVEARLSDRESTELESYNGLKAPWSDWEYLKQRARFWAVRLTTLVLRT